MSMIKPVYVIYEANTDLVVCFLTKEMAENQTVVVDPRFASITKIMLNKPELAKLEAGGYLVL